MDYQRWGSGIREATPIAKCDKTGKKERPFTQSLTTTFGCWNLYQKGCLSFSLSYDLHVLSPKILVLKYQGGSVHLDV